MLALVLLLVPAVTGCVAAATPWRRWVGWLCTASLGFVLVTASCSPRASYTARHCPRSPGSFASTP